MTAEQADYLRTLKPIRERCLKVFQLAQDDKLTYFKLHEDKLQDVIKFCASIITRDFGTAYSSIPPHSRWRHFTVPSDPKGSLISTLPPASTTLEEAKRLIDLFTVSVLLDAGAGDKWAYTAKNGDKVARSEGLAVGSFEAFIEGLFSSEDGDKLRVDAEALSKITPEVMGEALQVSPSNPMTGLEGRSNLLTRLSEALTSSPDIFVGGRPGGMLDFLSSSPGFKNKIHIDQLWSIVMDGFGPVWPAGRTNMAGKSLGDAWPCGALSDDFEQSIVPFHKLSQWLTYSLLEPIEKYLGWEIEGKSAMTGLPEYRNGGLLVDLGFLSLKTAALDASTDYKGTDGLPKFLPSHPAVIEWRAITVISLDKIADGIRVYLNAPDLTTAQVLESATWKGGREIARKLRPATGGPPIEIESDGTVF